MGRLDAAPNISTDNDSVCALVVTHHPEGKRLLKVIEALRSQVDRVLIIDNGSNDSTRSRLQGLAKENDCVLLENDKNLGLAAAYNQGIRWANKNRFLHILFLDQDSVSLPSMVRRLLGAIKKLDSDEARIAGVGPVIFDPRLGERRPFVTFSALGVKRRACDPRQSDKEIAADFLISSGMLAKTSVFDLVGTFDEGLFIDNVDLEWCFRASAKGYKCYGICGAELEHHLADKVKCIWLGRSIPIYYHSPVRQYYIMRNRILLYRKQYSPKAWIVQDIPRALFKSIVFSIFSDQRLENIKMMCLGIVHGLQGIKGEKK